LNGYDVATSDIVTNNLTVVMTRRLYFTLSWLLASDLFPRSQNWIFLLFFFFELKDFSSFGVV
jgi:hypothetical protein